MLFTDVFERQDCMPPIFGYDPDSMLVPVRKKLKEARHFVFDEQAVAMAANVSSTKPSSIISCLPFVRLPAPVVWMEFANQHLRNAMGHIGSPNVKPEYLPVDVERTGFLLWEEDGQIIMDHVRRIKLKGEAIGVTVSNVRLAFDPSTQLKSHTMMAAMSHLIGKSRHPDEPWKSQPGVVGRVEKHLKRIATEDAEAIAHKELGWRFGYMANPDQADFRAAVGNFMSEQQIKQLEIEQMEDAYRMFLSLILPGLILLNCKNAVQTEVVPPQDRLNKQRVKKGRPPIEGYHYVKMHLTPKKKRLYASRGIATNRSDGGLVIGHFKVRTGGIFWWSPHFRGPYSETTSQKVYVMTP